ncbi:MAG: MYG1 family protein [Candidatus Pacebacteria bacterium]|jgi:uncharacterized UPF0160 family protein|nr:MYG1 family protein [Candidatus Paceibacterota bacterium]
MYTFRNKNFLNLCNKRKTIAVHDGSFHTDDVFAVAALTLVYGKCVRIVRTRNQKKIEKASVVVDVGGEYDASRERFDHHQIDGAGTRENGIPYAAFGLVWKKYGVDLCGSKEIADKIDSVLVQPIDAVDNGIDIAKPLFQGIHTYGIHSIISSFIPTWKENRNPDTQFFSAVAFAKKLLLREIQRTRDYLEAIEYVVSMYHASKQKSIIFVDKPIGRAQIISALMEFPEPVYVVYPDREGQKWSAVAMLREFGSFESRKSFPLAWAGARDEALQKITGVSDAQFCHNKRFLATAHSKEGALALAQKALTS